MSDLVTTAAHANDDELLFQQLQERIEQHLFTVDFTKLPNGDPRVDEARLKSLLQSPIREMLGINPEIPDCFDPFRDRLSQPSYLESEKKLVTRRLFQGVSKHRAHPDLFLTVGPPASGKSTALRQDVLKAQRGVFLSDPDEGVLGNLDVYIKLRALFKAAAMAAPDYDPTSLEDRNQWRLPPYNLFRSASVAINTEATNEALKQRASVAFGWTGAGAFGLGMITNTYLPLGYAPHLLASFASHADSVKMEILRDRPATAQDFESKRVDFLANLPAVISFVKTAKFNIASVDSETGKPTRRSVSWEEYNEAIMADLADAAAKGRISLEAFAKAKENLLHANENYQARRSEIGAFRELKAAENLLICPYSPLCLLTLGRVSG